ncbi:MAG: type II toxin-antitoxin system RelE/ParE family toxin, partial [Campylobacterota bacterium]|nr:type II toxin-antitoxin system RelE/ParE family toxin [Campylobacterota bacterium]
MHKYSVIWTDNVQYDLELIIEYIKIDNVTIAKEIFFEIKNECDQLYYMPTRKRIVPELQQIGITKYREILYKRWRIVFKAEEDNVSVLIVADSSRNLEDILFQRLIKTDNNKS